MKLKENYSQTTTVVIVIVRPMESYHINPVASMYSVRDFVLPITRGFYPAQVNPFAHQRVNQPFGEQVTR